jgi:hypothetical protein
LVRNIHTHTSIMNSKGRYNLIIVLLVALSIEGVDQNILQFLIQ